MKLIITPEADPTMDIDNISGLLYASINPYRINTNPTATALNFAQIAALRKTG
jgi:hypothetical protein